MKHLTRKLSHRIVAAVAATLSCAAIFVCIGAQADSEALRLQCQSLVDSFDYSLLKQKAAELLNAGIRTNDTRLCAWGYTYLGGAQLFGGESNKAENTIKRGIAEAEKIKNDTILASAYNTLGIYEATAQHNLYLAQRYFLKSRQYAHDCGYTRVEMSMGSNLAELAIELRDTAGFTYAKECYDYGVKSHQPRYQYSGLLNMAELAHLKNDYDAASRYATMAMALALKHGYRNIEQIHLLNSVIAMERGNFNDAISYADMAIEETLKGNNTVTLPKIYLNSALAHMGAGNIDTALTMLNKGADAANKYDSYSVIADIYETMSKIYEQKGDDTKALYYLRLSKDSIDSNYQSDKRRLNNERELLLDIEARENAMKIQQLKVSSQHRLIWILAIALLLLLFVLFYVILNHRRKHRLYDSLVTQNRKVVELREELRAAGDGICASLTADDDKTPDDETKNTDNLQRTLSDEKAKRLWLELNRLMTEERLYADPRITRENIIERLATNRTYLTQVIARYSSMNYSQFVNSFRVDAAIKFLSSELHAGYPLKQLSTDLGFGSLTTFYKVFNTATGMSPAAFRKSALSM